MEALTQWILPAILAAGAALALPWWLSRRLPETMGGLALNLVISCLVMWGLSVAYFVAAYLAQDARIAAAIGPGLAGAWHFARLGLLSALLWGPLVALVLVTRPATWRPPEDASWTSGRDGPK